MEFKAMKKLLRASLPTKRYEHSLAVCETAVRFAQAHGADIERVRISALLHDCGREIASRDNLAAAAKYQLELDEIERNQPVLIHAKLGAYLAQHKYGVTDPEILEGILCHTTGKPGMSTLAKLVYLADLLEPTRGFEGIEEMRELALKDLDKTMMKAYVKTMRYLLEYDLLVHPNCLAAYNELAIKYKALKLANAQIKEKL